VGKWVGGWVGGSWGVWVGGWMGGWLAGWLAGWVGRCASGKLNENRNLMWTRREQICLILISSTNTYYENMASRSFRSEKYSVRVP
jgi:hypothetical protein